MPTEKYEKLIAELNDLKKDTLIVRHIALMEKLEELDQVKAELRDLKEQFAILMGEKFGSRSEKNIEANSKANKSNQPDSESDNETDDDADKPDDKGAAGNTASKQISVRQYTRKKATNKRQMNLDALPRVPRYFNNDICDCCTEKMDLLRKYERELLHHIPEQFFVFVDHISVYVCRNKKCTSSGIKTNETPDRLMKMGVTEELLAFLVCSKLASRQPIYHLEQMFKSRYGFTVPRKNMYDWFIKGAQKLVPLINLLKDEIRDYDIAGMDATRLLIIRIGKMPESQELIKKLINMYCFIGGRPGRESIVFEPSFWKHSEYLLEWFMDWVGYIHCDADPLHKKVLDKKGINDCLCNSHSRRRFVNALKYSIESEHAAKMVDYYKELYGIESEIRDIPDAEERLRQRKTRSEPIMKNMKGFLDSLKEKLVQKSIFGRAVSYAVKYWDGLLTFLTDGRLPIDNNRVERQIYPFATARKNFLFAFGKAGAEAIGIYMSLIRTAVQHKLDPLGYLTEVFQNIPKCKTFSDYEKLLPWNIKLHNGIRTDLALKHYVSMMA